MARKVLAIDPGNEFSAYAVYVDGQFVEYSKVENRVMIDTISQIDADMLVVGSNPSLNLSKTSTPRRAGQSTN